ncbi:wall-associated receptor kinase 5-like [Rutidosis leptorrhynchoides]|uniref:wall-associated receptor kinase 5-like n=1 Tax=Rutidosis leptorrhynchoides TaxID=125765 RepID=UPI003A995D8A
MSFHKLLQLLFLKLVLHSNLIQTRAKPGPECSEKCGNITIPYPFGIAQNCYLHPSYSVTCNTTSGKITILGMNVDVVDISQEDHILRAETQVGRVCYNETDQVLLDEPYVNLSRFPLSPNRNTLIIIGFDTQSTIESSNITKASCTTTGEKCLHNVNSCTNTANCCQTTIPKPFETFQFKIESVKHNAGKPGYTNCSYAFIREAGIINFRFDSYNLTSEMLESYEMVLDWSVGKTDCQKAQNNTSTYLCKDNSECFDSTNARSYRCNYAAGYRGNPYLENGCQDMNECEDSSLNDCTHLCYNTIRNYTCHCPKGYSGDGRKDGSRCTKKTTNVQKLGLYIGISMGVILTSITTFLSYCLLKQRRAAKQKEELFKRNGEELKKATNNFNSNNVIGQGGFGTVYKGILIDGTVVVIKKSKVIDPNQIRQFVNEVVLLSQINHPNIVKLVGCCLETNVPLLAYEYIVNETLHHHLHGQQGGCLLTWSMRLNIAVETAGALDYMHSSTKIIHRDIKSSNILLDDDYTVKVSDFGISRSVPKEIMEVSTAVQGTLGYIDPEYFSSGILTETSDVYSFGVLVVELLTGEKVNSLAAIKRNRSLVDHFIMSLVNAESLVEILDDQVKVDCEPGQLNQVVYIVKSCLQRERQARPTMRKVKEDLLSVQTSLGLVHSTQEIVSFISDSDVPE